jgi:hypothetical protein
MMSPEQKVYLSHAPADLEIASQLAKYLEQDGFQTSGIHSAAGQLIGSKSNFYESVLEVRGCVILLTADSLADEHVKRETNIAIENKIPIYPVNLTGEDELKKLLSSEWRYWLSITQILTCSDAREASTKLRFRLSADAASKMEEDFSVRESILGSWRAFESLFEQIGISKVSHTSIGFQELHNQFDNEVVPGFTQSSRRFKSSKQADKVENRFAGKMIFALYGLLQYFDCHSLTIDRTNSCGLKGHEVETLIERYIKFAAISFEYPSAITWYTETQFLWNYKNFTETCPPLLKSENFWRYSEVLTLDYEPFYNRTFDGSPENKKWDHKPEVSLKAHVFDDLSKYVFYDNVSVLARENTPTSDLNLALNSVNDFLAQPGFEPGQLESLAAFREDYQMSGYPTLLLFKAYLLKLLGAEVDAKLAIQEFNIIELPSLRYFLTQSLSASNGVGKYILEQLWGFFLENYETDMPQTESLEENLDSPDERSFTVAEQLYFLANNFSELGDTDTALDLWARAARSGVFSGLASYTWATLQTGAFDVGVALYEECSEMPCDPMYQLEKYNCTGNYLLNLLARDNDFARAIENFNSLILEEGDDTTFGNHISLLTLEVQYGNSGRAIQIFESIPSDVLLQLKQAYEEEAIKAKGWLLGWCLQVLKVLSEIGKG